jgi:DNA-directed RNA polymerase subunit RPC12/RpoP
MSGDPGSVDLARDIVRVSFRCGRCGRDNTVRLTGAYLSIAASAYSEPRVKCPQCGHHLPLSSLRPS